jgi:hypothetical protein
LLNNNVLFEKTAIQLRNQSPFHVQADPGNPNYQGGGQEKNNRKKWRAEEVERHKEQKTQDLNLKEAASGFQIKKRATFSWKKNSCWSRFVGSVRNILHRS